MKPPPKVPNAERRSREHLTPAEIDRLIAAAQRLGRHGHRDATMILLAYRHGRKRKPTPTFRRGLGLSTLRAVVGEAVRDGCERVLL